VASEDGVSRGEAEGDEEVEVFEKGE